MSTSKTASGAVLATAQPAVRYGSRPTRMARKRERAAEELCLAVELPHSSQNQA